MKRKRDIFGAFVLDRAAQYSESSGSYDALVNVAAQIIRGDAEEAHAHGELDDEQLTKWVARIRNKRGMRP